MPTQLLDIRQAKTVEVLARDGEPPRAVWRPLYALKRAEARAALLALQGRVSPGSAQRRLVAAALRAVGPRAGESRGPPKAASALPKLMLQLQLQQRQLAAIEQRVESLSAERLRLDGLKP